MTVIPLTQRSVLLVRVYAIACALAILPLSPVYFAKLDRARIHPIDVAAGQPQADGSVLVGASRVEAMRIDSEPWAPAASPAYGRRLRNLPVGTVLTYRLTDAHGTHTVPGT